MNPSASPRFTGAVARASPWPRITGIPALPCGIAAARTRRFAAACTLRLSTGPAPPPLPAAPRAGHDASSPLCAKQKLLCTRQNRAGRLPSRAWSVGARPMPEGVDPAPLVDFCNQNSPRAQPLISRSPAGASKVALLRPAWVVTPQPLFRTDPRGPAPRSCLRNRALADPARSRERARASRASRPAGSCEQLKQAGGPSGLPGDTNRAFSGQGPSALGGRRLPCRAPRRVHATGASPQPDPLGHLLSWDRASAGWRARRRRRSHPAGPTYAGPAKGRLTRTSAKRGEIRCTRGAFRP